MTNRWPPVLRDVAVVAVLLVFGLGGTGGAARNQHATAPPPAYLLVVICCLAILGWRTRPMWTFALAGTATMVYIGLDYPYGPILVMLAIAIYGVVTRQPLRRAVIAVAALQVAGIAAVSVGVVTGDRDWTEYGSLSAWLLVPAAVGIAVQVRRDAQADVRTEQARRAVSEERLYLAQEVHDVVGHSLAVIAMQAGIALRLLDREPERSRSALTAIRSASQEALDGLRAEVAALRREPAAASPLGAVPRRPASGLADLSGLAERMRSAGLPVDVDCRPAAVTGLPSDVDHTAYRIVQESLTNVLRHAGPDATAYVHIGLVGEMLHVEVLDTGRGAVPDGPPGHGIEGMRERAERLGGRLDVGPGPSGGFAVRGWLPALDGAAR